MRMRRGKDGEKVSPLLEFHLGIWKVGCFGYNGMGCATCVLLRYTHHNQLVDCSSEVTLSHGF